MPSLGKGTERFGVSGVPASHAPSPCSLRAMLKANFGDFAQNPILLSQQFVGKPHQQHVKREAVDVPSERCVLSLLQQAPHSNIDVSVDGLTAKAPGRARRRGSSWCHREGARLL